MMLHRVLAMVMLLTPLSVASAVEPSEPESASAPAEFQLPPELEAQRERGRQAHLRGRPADVIAVLTPLLPNLVDAYGPQHPVTLETRERLAFARHQSGTDGEAIRELEACVAARRAVQGAGSEGFADAANLLSIAYGERDDWDASVHFGEKALAELNGAGAVVSAGVVALEWSVSISWARLGDPERGSALLEAQLGRLEAHHGPDAPETLMALAKLGSFERENRGPERGRAVLEPAIVRATAAVGADDLATRKMKLHLARCYIAEQRFTKALALLRPLAQSLDPDTDDFELVIDTYRELGLTESTLGKPSWRNWIEAAITHAKARMGPESLQVARLYDVLVQRLTTRTKTDYERVSPFAIDAVRIRRDLLGPDHPRVIEAELRLVRLQLDVDRLDEARTILESLTERAAGADDVVTVLLQERLAELYAEDGEAEAALEVRRSIARRVSLLPKDVVGLYNVLNDMYIAWYLHSLGRQDEAREVTERCMAALNAELLERLLHNGDDVVMHLLQQWDVAAHLMLSIRDQSKYNEENWGELLVWRGFGPRLAADRARRARVDPELAALDAQRAEIRRQIADRVAALARGSGAKEDQVEGLQALRGQAERLELELLERLPSPTPSELAPTVQALCDALPRKSRLVDVVRWSRLDDVTEGTPAYDAFILSPEDCSVARVSLGKRDGVDREVARWRRAITAVGADPSLAERFGAEVAEVVLAPLMPHLGGAEQLILIPDEQLALIPWAALPHPAGGYLVEHLELSVLQDPVELLRPRVRGAPRPDTLLVGGVDYGALDDAIAEVEPTEDAEDFDRSTCLGGRFRPLPGTVSELDAVGRAVSGDVQRLQGTTATPDAVRKGMEGASRIHLATHGFFLDERCLESDQVEVDAALASTPLARSGLALSGANDGAALQGDGLLTAQDLLDLDLHQAELVVLSACDTGRGTLTQGQGVMGLRWALSLAGVRNQVFSLWPVPDRDTALLMADFYAALGRGAPCRRCGAAAALRHAQLQALARQRAQDRVDIRAWAAFQASGPPRAMR